MRARFFSTIRRWLVLALAIAQIVAPFLPQVLGWNSSIAQRSMQNETPAVPIGSAFSVWSVIFAGSLAFSIFGLLPENRKNTLWQHVAWMVATLYALNTLWELYVPLRNLDWGAVTIIAVATAIAILIVLRIAAWSSPLTTGERWCIAVLLQIFAGWLSAATFVSFPSTLVWAGVTLIDPRSDLVAILAVGCATALACVVIIAARSLPYAATISWAILGIIIGNVVRDDRPVIVAAAIAGLLVIGVTVIALMNRPRALSAKL
jgi:hypothetical protein